MTYFPENELAPLKIPLQEWIREYTIYNILRNVPCFKYNLLSKI